MDEVRHGRPIRIGDLEITPVWTVRVHGWSSGPAIVLQGSIEPTAVIVEGGGTRQVVEVPSADRGAGRRADSAP